MTYQYRIVTHAGAVYAEYRQKGTDGSWKHAQDESYNCWDDRHYYHDVYFYTVWGAKRWIRRQVKKDMMSAKLDAEKAKDPVVVWGPYP